MDTEICEFVDQRFGTEETKKMLNIRKGGDNNEKGNKFEQYYSVSFIIETIAKTPDDISEITVSSQELGFVDDFIVRNNKISRKINYQAKNSSGSAADWTDEMHNRFAMQDSIDLEFHKYESATQVLLVSSEQKHIDNKEKIKLLNNPSFSSEFFPYENSVNQLINTSQQTRNALEKICGQKSLSKLDFGFKVMLGAWEGSSGERTISDVFQQAKSMAHPDIFKPLTSTKVPDWLTNKINSLNNIDLVVESTNFSVHYNGFEVDIYHELPEPPESELSKIINEFDFMAFLIEQTKDDYKS